MEPAPRTAWRKIAFLLLGPHLRLIVRSDVTIVRRFLEPAKEGKRLEVRSIQARKLLTASIAAVGVPTRSM